VTLIIDSAPGWLADPRVAYVLLALGIASLLAEAANPGIVGTGVLGVAAVLAGLWSLALQAVTPVGLGLVVVAAACFAAELLTKATGPAAAAGSAAFLAGGLVLIEPPGQGLPASVAVPTALALGLAATAVGVLAARTRALPASTGEGALVGRDLVVERADGATGEAFVAGAWWRIRTAGDPLEPGVRARVVARDGLDLVVEPQPKDRP
jgi:membrane-bound serine protease (ClpP class)